MVGHSSRQVTKIYEFNVPLSVLVPGGRATNMTCHALGPNVNKKSGRVTKNMQGDAEKNMDGAGPEFFFPS